MKRLLLLIGISILALGAIYFVSQTQEFSGKASKVTDEGRFVEADGTVSYFYSTDGTSVFFNPDQRSPAPLNQVKMSADLKTFEVLLEVGQAYGYARDKNHVYVFDVALPGVDPKTFVRAAEYNHLSEKNIYFRDKSHLYMLNKAKLYSGVPGEELFTIVE